MQGVVWKLMEKVGGQFVQFIIQIVLARLLLPEDYGIIGLVTIFITVSDVFLQQGLPTALIQKENADRKDYSSVFYANIGVAIIIYIILFCISPWIAKFYNEDKLTLIMRVLALNVIVGSISAVHNAILSKRLEFKQSFYRNMSNILTQGIVGIYLAYRGWGVWALVISKVAGTLVGTIILAISVHWKPELYFSWNRIRELFKFGSKILGSNLLNTVFNNIHSLIIGHYFNTTDLGYYQRGQQIPQTIMTAIDGSMNEVLYPTLSNMQDDIYMLKNALRRSMKLSMFVVIPMLMGLIAISDALVVILLTDKWSSCVPFMKLACIICMFWPLSARTHAINAIGRSDITFKISLVSKIITIVFIFLCIRGGIYAIMLGTILASFIAFWITTYYTQKLIYYTVKELWKDIGGTLILSLVMCVLVSGIQYFQLNMYIELFIQIIVGVFVYVMGAKVFKMENYKYIIDMLKNKIKK